MPSYRYKPLAPGHIRLVTLYPGQETDPIRISIDQAPFSLTKYPTYESLSYCWGSPKDPLNIIVTSDQSSLQPNGTVSRLGSLGWRRRSQSSSSASLQNGSELTLGVWQNLHSALQHLRQKSKPRVLWIDAICISQMNTHEKSDEIQQMGNIYRKAKRVIAWLGPGSTGSSKAVEALDHLGRQVVWHADAWVMKRATNCEPRCREWYTNEGTLPYDTEIWHYIGDLLGRSWFTRVWIWQEIWLANQDTAVLMCGYAEISWTHFKNAAVCIYMKYEHGTQPELMTKSMRDRLRPVRKLVTITSGQSILELLCDMRKYSFCDDPRDRIYAILDLGSDAPDLGIEADYEKSKADVYREFCVKFAHERRTLSFLTECELNTRDMVNGRYEGPSWVPNWSIPVQYCDFELSSHTGSRRGHCEFIDNDICRVKGIFCGAIKSCSDPIPLDTTRAELLEMLPSLLSQVMGRTPTGEEPELDELINVFIDGWFRSRIPYGYPILEESREFLRNALDPHLAPEVRADLVSDTTLTRLIACSPGRCLFKTADDDYGLGPPMAQPGDQIYSIIGCTTLILLRRYKNGRFEIVGQCNRQSTLDLEVLFGPLPKGWYVKDGLHRNYFDMWYHNSNTGEKTRQDPRLKPEVDGWWCDERDKEERVVWEHKWNGERTFYDPRLSDVKFLTERGVMIETIDLI